MPDFLGIERLSLGPWPAFERALARLLTHAGLDDVRVVGGSGDLGADVVGSLKGRTWVLQAKHRGSGQLIGASAVEEVVRAIGAYDGAVGVVATNTGFTEEAVRQAQKMSGDIGVPIYLWDGERLLERSRKLPQYPEKRHDPRPYQQDAIDAITNQISDAEANTALLLMATGLGKTRVAAGVIEQWIRDRPGSEILLLAPGLPLVPQLESALWPYLPKEVPTHILTGSEKPSFNGGVTVATEQSMINRATEATGRYGLVIVDEAHHAPASGYRKLLSQLEPQMLLGLTATPWRGDERQLDDIFGKPTFSMSVVEGMQAGYLAEVDYRMLIDDIDWDWVRAELVGSVSINELNRKLFVPERDEAAVGKIGEHMDRLVAPRCIVFCRSIDHAETIGRLLQADGRPARVLHSRLDRVEATVVLHEFRSGTVPTIVTVDMLNEGIDVPDVNLIVFLRVTHSRRIFIQQLGRGLRVSPGKSGVLVLDFVSDIRRIAAAQEMNREASSVASTSPENKPVRYPTGKIVSFNGDTALSLFDEYLSDIGELETKDDGSRLKFPPRY